MQKETDKEFICLSHEKLDVSQALQFAVLPWTGGSSIFVGTTRNRFQDKKVITLFYEAYETMAMKEMKIICDDISSKFDVGRICIMHRLGEVPVGEASVVICISSEHRKNAIHAVEFAIDEVKAKVPIWKKEIYDDGKSEWKENKEIFWKNKET